MMARVKLTPTRIDEFTSKGKAQAFLWAKNPAGLALRATANGAKAFVFQSKLNGATLRMTIGSPDAWRIPSAEAEARRLQTVIDAGRDPRLEKAATIQAEQQTRAAKKLVRQREEITGLDAWPVYCEARRTEFGPKGKKWGPRSLADHQGAASPGHKRKRSAGMTRAGILHALLSRPLAQLDADTTKAWAKSEAKKRKTRAALAFRLLRGFLNWAATRDEYKALVDPSVRDLKEVALFGQPGKGRDVLLLEMLPPWFAAMRAAPNKVGSAYLQTLLLLGGARPGEIQAMKWADVDTKWRRVELRDKVAGERSVPLTPYVASLLATLPRRNQYVFSGTRSAVMSNPNEQHTRACREAGIEGLTLHGLRRSYPTLTEWLEVPAGIVAQLQGHKPSGVREKNYIIRPLDLLRVHAERIEAWILEQAGVKFEATTERLRAVK